MENTDNVILYIYIIYIFLFDKSSFFKYCLFVNPYPSFSLPLCYCLPQLLEYVGKGKSIMDVGLAQARQPLTTRCHYYEVEIVDAGEKCYIALGLARRVSSQRKEQLLTTSHAPTLSREAFFSFSFGPFPPFFHTVIY